MEEDKSNKWGEKVDIYNNTTGNHYYSINGI